ncbi:hypothetical protein cce_0794 [Crocosphaera subtropica ATCC 51142]|uniref:Uncharacterized protein n=1 Tax=Crocosphaera subtropica (strain ATCC 51142 / BH68) TaxID=43989 RepID=B1WR87_CROS5|nr:hypothetical protein cce_0794 [Crocosphaera subtropica ATCC 51142]
MVLSRNDSKQPVQVAKYVPKLSEVQKLEIEQKKNVMLLVENLMQREAATFKMIIDCLYDVGSLNLINKKVSLRFLKSLIRFIVKLAKTIFRSIAFYWVVKNTPELITNWLINKIMISREPKRKPLKTAKKSGQISKAKKAQIKQKKKIQKKSPTVVKYFPKLSEAQKLEIEQRKNVILLVENLMEREEATFKMIIDCLYEVGSVNLINQKVAMRPLNRVMRLIARLSKPSFRAVAFYWVKRNTPELITDWLLSKVRF